MNFHITMFEGKFYGDHGVFTGTLLEYLQEVKDFLDSFEKEVVIMHFRQFNKLLETDMHSLIELMKHVFKDMLCPMTYLPILTLEYIRKTGKRAIVVISSVDYSAIRNHSFGSLVWSDCFLATTPESQSHITRDMIEYLDGAQEVSHSSEKLTVVKGVVSPDFQHLLSSNSMRDYVLNVVNPALEKWIWRQEKLNVVMADHVGSHGILDAILALNGQPEESILPKQYPETEV